MSRKIECSTYSLASLSVYFFIALSMSTLGPLDVWRRMQIAGHVDLKQN